MNILAVGDVVGRPGRRAIRDLLAGILEEHRVDLCIVNGENASGGSGITPEYVDAFLSQGADVITTGDHVWRQREIYPYLDAKKPVLRPANFPDDARGRGLYKGKTASGTRFAVINVMGRVFMQASDCPFRTVDALLRDMEEQYAVIVVDMHAEATSEKIALGWHLDGRVSAVFGTHTHVQTADETVLKQGTGYITDVGMTGPYESVIGRKIEPVLKKFITQMPFPFDVAKRDIRLCGVLFDVDADTGRCRSVQRIRRDLPT